MKGKRFGVLIKRQRVAQCFGGPSDLHAFGETRGVAWAEAPFPGLTKVSEASEGASAAWRRC